MRTPHVTEFMRFSAPDRAALATGIAEVRAKLATAVQAGDSLAVVDAAADLGALLTTARREAEAVQLLELHQHLVEAQASQEPAGWFWNAPAITMEPSI
jgi:hypothetical protein